MKNEINVTVIFSFIVDLKPITLYYRVTKCSANLYWICLNEHKTCAYADTVQICGNIWNAYYLYYIYSNKCIILDLQKTKLIGTDINLIIVEGKFKKEDLRKQILWSYPFHFRPQHILGCMFLILKKIRAGYTLTTCWTRAGSSCLRWRRHRSGNKARQSSP